MFSDKVTFPVPTLFSCKQCVAAGVGAVTGLWELVSSVQCPPVSPSVPLSWDRGNGIEARPRPRPRPPLNTCHYLILLYYDSGEF